MNTRPVQAGAAMPVHIVNPGDISSTGGTSGQATAAKQDQQTTLLTSIAGYTDGIEALLTAISGYVDGLETLVGTTNTNTNTTNGKLDTLSSILTSIAGYVDGLETLVGTTNTNTNTTNGKLDTLSSILTSIAGYVDGLETLVGTTNTNTNTTNGKLDTVNSALSSIAGYTDGIETLLTTISGYVDGLEGQLTALFPSSIGQKTKSGSLSVTLASDSDALPAGENVIGATVGKSSNITVNPTVSTSPAYSSGDSIGGKFTLTSAMRVSGGSGYLQSIMILDRANQKPAGTILIYNADPTNATLTDNSALSNSTDDQKIVAAISVAASDYTTINSKAYANLSSLGRGVKAASGTTLYASFVTTSTPTFAATTDLQLVFSFLLD